MFRYGIGPGTLLGLFLMLLPASAVSILQDFHHKRWTREDGLPDTRIHFLLQSGDGYLWMGTRNGLVRFDGRTFVTYTRANTGLLDGDVLHRAAIDTDGHLLFDQNHHVLALTGWRGRGLERGPLLQWTSGSTWFVQDPQWTGSRSLRAVVDRLPLWWSRWDPLARITLGEKHHADIFESSDGIVYLAGENVLVRTNPATGWHDSHPMPDYGGGWKLDARFCEDTHRQMWVRWVDRENARAQLYRIDANGPVPIGEVTPANSGRAEFLLAARDGSLWQPAGAYGLERIQDGILSKYEMPWGRDLDFALCMLEDREGHLWVGTEEFGLHRLRRRRAQTLGTAHGLPTASIRSVAAQGNSVWIGTDSGLARLETRQGLETDPQLPGSRDRPSAASTAIHNTPALRSAPDPIASKEPTIGTFQPTFSGDRVVAFLAPLEPGSDKPRSVRCLDPISATECWIGTDRGLFLEINGVLNPAPIAWLPSLFDKDSLQTRKLRALCRDDSGTLWMAAAGVVMASPANRSVSQPVHVYGFYGAAPTVLMRDRSGFLWVGTEGKGTARFRPSSVLQIGTEDQMTNRARVPLLTSMEEVEWLRQTNGLSSDHIWDIYQDSRGAIWIVAENGLNRIPPLDSWPHAKGPATFRAEPPATPSRIEAAATPSSPRLPDVPCFVFKESLGPFHGSIRCLIEDDLGWMWFGTDQGVYRVPLQNLIAVAEGRTNRVQTEAFLEPDGLPSLEIGDRLCHPSVCKTEDGRLWFATSDGVAVFDPHALNQQNPAPQVAVEEFRADDISEFATGPGGHSPVWEPIPGQPSTASRLRLPPGRARQLEFRYTALHFANPESCRFRYRLDGYDNPDEWHDVGPRRSAHFTNLDPGDYRFRVQAANAHGIWSSEDATLAFVLEPYYWQTWTFRISTALAVLALAAGIVSWRVREIRRWDQWRHEKSLLSERLDLARDLHDIVGAQFTELIRLGDLAGRLPVEQAVPHQRRMAELARELFHAVRHSMWATTPEADNLPSLIDYLEVAARRLLNASGVALKLELPESIPSLPLSPTSRRHLYLAAQEAVNNAIKHAHATQLTIRLTLESNAFLLDIEDNGCGIPPEIHQRLATGNHPSRPGVGGHGLGNIRKRIEESGGTCQFLPNTPKGLRVRFRIPHNRPA